MTKERYIGNTTQKIRRLIAAATVGILLSPLASCSSSDVTPNLEATTTTRLDARRVPSKPLNDLTNLCLDLSLDNPEACDDLPANATLTTNSELDSIRPNESAGDSTNDDEQRLAELGAGLRFDSITD